MEQLGVSFSGGGVRCVAHLGIVKAWQEVGIVPERYAGTSAGALVAALLAAGHSPDAIFLLIRDLKLRNMLHPVFRSGGLLDIRKSLGFATDVLPESFADLQIPVDIATINFRSGQLRYFLEGNLHEAVLASCCMPVFFAPVMIDGEPYVDGGLISNLPVDSIRPKVNFLVGIHSNPVSPDFRGNGFQRLIERSLLITINANVQNQRQRCDLFLEPPFLANYRVFDFSKLDVLFQESYQWARVQDWSMLLKK